MRTKLMETWVRVVLVGGALVGASAGATSLFPDGLQVQFRSDTGRCLGDSGLPQPGMPVDSWTTEDGVASPLTLGRDQYRPNWKEGAFTRADGTTLPAVRFMRNPDNTDDVKSGDAYIPNMRLVAPADQATTLNLGTRTTWFLVMNYLCSQHDGSVFGFADEPRFGAFVLGAGSGENKLRLHNNYNSGAAGVIDMTPGYCLLDSRADGTRMTSGTNGTETINVGMAATARTANSRFGIGSMLSTVPNTARFDCG